MKNQVLQAVAFWGLVAAYALLYAPWGTNETDGGFLTGLAWQVLQGKPLYEELLYVRPPVSVWMRALELSVLPDSYAVLGERWVFYLKAGWYCWLGAALLGRGAARFWIAAFGFVLSVHNYPPMAWHTVDGIVFAVTGLYLLRKFELAPLMLLGGFFLGLSAGCKQSFYPMVFAGIAYAFLLDRRRGWWVSLGAGLSIATLGGILANGGQLADFLALSTAASGWREALKAGLVDYFRVHPAIAIPAVFLLLPVAHALWSRRPDAKAYFGMAAWGVFLLWMAGYFVWSVSRNAEFTVPFSQSRVLFWGTAFHLAFLYFVRSMPAAQVLDVLVQMALAWCASISWGYNVPLLFSVPVAWAVLDISRTLWDRNFRGRSPAWVAGLCLALLAGSFRYAQEYVYRDGRRSAMNRPLESVFHRLRGIHSNEATLGMYAELKSLSAQYPDFAVLPSFPQAHFLCGKPSPLPLDWVVKREMGGREDRVWDRLMEIRPVIFLEKQYEAQLVDHPEFQLVSQILEKYRLTTETDHFNVYTFHE